MNSLLRLPSLMLMLAALSPAALPAHSTRTTASTRGSDAPCAIHELAHAFGPASPTLAFYIPRPPRGPQV
ncbi:MAG: hypothetical protein JO015_07560 [Verrucomicrobia bacterium]|nr:hypothetical protein [Verrucomicrobiota bacterium]